MKALALVPALALTAALLVPPLAEAGQRHRSDRDHRARSRQHGYYYNAPRSYGHGYDRYRPYSYRGYRYYAPPVPYGYYGYPPAPYGYYGYYPPPYDYHRPRGGFYLNFGFRF